jgi:hypothetical protein
MFLVYKFVMLFFKCVLCNCKYHNPTFWLRHCATSRKAAGSIPNGVIENFHRIKPSAPTVTLGSTQPLTEMSTKGTNWG